MLVLTRRLGEKLLIGDDIVVTVVDIDRGKIRLGIEAPREVFIAREELGKKNPRLAPLRDMDAADARDLLAAVPPLPAPPHPGHPSSASPVTPPTPPLPEVPPVTPPAEKQ